MKHDSDHDRRAGEAAHGGHGHTHGSTDETRLMWAFVVIFAFMFVEVVGGVWSGSLALLADAMHMVSDAAALGLGWLAARLGSRPATDRFTYGQRRFEIIAAFANGCMLLVVAAWIVWEAVQRLSGPVTVHGGPMLAVACAGLGASLAAFWILNGGDRSGLNMRSAWLHVLSDMLGFIAAIVAAGVVLATGWTPIDPILSIGVALMLVRSAWRVAKASAHVLLEGVPDGIDIAEIRRDVQASFAFVEDVHHIHAWSITPDRILLTMHVRSARCANAFDVAQAIHRHLKERFRIEHATIQVEPAVAGTDGKAAGGQAGLVG